jgi:histone-lysine N-methyltransferase SETMAR
MLEQRHVIRFLLKDHVPPALIPGRLSKVYGEDAMKKTQVFYWVAEIRGGREDLSDERRPGRPPDVGIDTILAHRLEKDPHTTARKLALSLGVSPQTVVAHLHKSLGMKNYHLRWVPHELDDDQKAERARCARLMLEELDRHAETNFHYLLTGDESWMLYDQQPSRMWAIDREHVDTIVRPSHHARKTMVTVFFGINGPAVVKILPQGAKFTTEYFIDEILQPLQRKFNPNARPGRISPFELHFDNAPVHNSKAATQKLMEYGMCRLVHPPYSPDLAPCDFFLFGYLREKLKDMKYDTPEDLEDAVLETISTIPRSMLTDVFADWRQRLAKCIQVEGDYFE